MADPKPVADPKTTRPWLRPFAIALLAVVAPALLYWFIYSERRVDAWERQAWQVLDGVGEELQAKVEVQSAIATAKVHAAMPFAISPADAASRKREGAKSVPLEGRGEFDGILILDGEKGEVLAQSEKLPHLAVTDGIELWGPDGRRLRIARSKVESVDSKSGKPEIDESHKPTATVTTLLGLDRHPSIEIAGEQYAAFLVPVRIKGKAPSGMLVVAKGEDQTIDFLVVGLVSASHLHAHALRLSPIALVWIAALVTGAFLVLPFVKIRFMGRRERLKAWDMWLLAGSAFLAAGMATLLILQIYAYSSLLHTMDADLVGFTKLARNHVRDELAAAATQLAISTPELARDLTGSAEARVLETRTFEKYPYFKALFLTDTTAQVAKWIPDPVATPLVPLDDQPWFPRALALRAPSQFLLELAVARRTTGLDLAVVAVPTWIEPFGIGVLDEPRRGVAAIATELVSIRDAVLPRSFRFAVVRPGGAVALRSARAPARGTNFFVEAPDMQALVEAAAEEPFNGPIPKPSDHRYRGSMQRATAIPLWLTQPGQAPAPVLVAYYDKEPIEQFAATLVINASIWLIVLVAVSLAAAALARAIDRRALDLAWPARERASLYRVVSIALLLFAVAMLATEKLPEWTLPYLVIGAPALGLMALALVAARMNPSPAAANAPAPPSYPACYVGFVMIGLVTFVATPILVVYRDSAPGHRAAFEESIRSGPNQAQVASPGSPYSVWTSYPFEIGESAVAVSSPSEPESWCNGLFRFDSESLPRNYFSLVVDACLPRSLRAPLLSSSPLASVDARGLAPRPDAGAKTARLWIALAVLGALALFWWFVREVATQILGLRLEGDGVVDGSGQIPNALPLRSVLLRPPSEVLQAVEQIITQQGGDVVDLRIEADVVALAPLFGNPGLAILVVGLECRLDDPVWRKDLLALLEAERTAPLVFVAAVEPLYFLQNRGRELDGASKLAEGEIEHWSRALEEVWKIRFPLLPTLSALSPGVDPGLAGWVSEECRWDDRLAAIGDSLLARTDLASFNQDDVIEYVLDEAEAHYRALWSLCCVAERLVLVQLAEEGFVNPRCFDLLRRLRRRRLIRVDPRFRLMNESFRRFALEIEERATVLGWEREGAAESSARVRGPLLALGFVAAAILLLTQGREIADALGYASATGSLVAAVATVAMRARAVGARA